jgi:hypothetical protein
MQLSIPLSIIKAMKRQFPSKAIYAETLKYYEDRNRDEDDFSATIELKDLSFEELNAIHPLAKKANDNALFSRVGTLINLKNNIKEKRVGSLPMLAEALKIYMDDTPHKWLFASEADDVPMPYFVKSIEYHPPTSRSSAYVDVDLEYVALGKSRSDSIVFHTKHLGHSVPKLLENHGFYRETEAAVKEYELMLRKYKEIRSKTGKVFVSSGVAYPNKIDEDDNEDSWEAYTISMERDGAPSKVVMDDAFNEKKQTAQEFTMEMADWSFWTGEEADADGNLPEKEEKDEDEQDSPQHLPVHTNVKVFDLKLHRFMKVNVSYLEEHKFDPNLINKLVLPEEHKSLINILMSGSAEVAEDIIRGKTGGIFVITSGPPGTGKTLTAEVFSESTSRALYVVQCSQLGTDEETIEGRLDRVLQRAQRWGALLLLDESDVYVHARGSDIQQNAVVGVFLRVLEYYRGIIFMTTNRATVIDDAIMSRATAWIQYDRPQEDKLISVWTILSQQYGVELTKKEICEVVETWKDISGRSIKNMLKLANLMAKFKKCKVSVPLLKEVSKFLDLSNKEE